jgi:hypothetical protein
VELLLRGVDVAEGELVLRDEQVGEAVGGLPPMSVKEVGGILRFGVGFALGLLQLRDGGAAAAGDDEGGADALEFEVLQVVVVPAEVGGDAVFLEQRQPGGVQLGNQLPGAVRTVGARRAVLSFRLLSRVSCRVGVAFRRGGCGAALRVARRIFSEIR